MEAADALELNDIDVALYVSAPQGPAVQRLLRSPRVSLLSLRHAEAYIRHFPFLTRLELPEDAVDLKTNLPPADKVLIAATASLVAVPDLHPVIIDLLLGAAREIHGGGSLIRRPGELPSSLSSEYPLSPDAERFHKSGPSTLQRYLPFWAVVWIQRLIFFGLPILAVGIPLLRFAPISYRWLMRRRIYRWYGELAFLERAARLGEGDRDAQLQTS